MASWQDDEPARRGCREARLPRGPFPHLLGEERGVADGSKKAEPVAVCSCSRCGQTSGNAHGPRPVPDTRSRVRRMSCAPAGPEHSHGSPDSPSHATRDGPRATEPTAAWRCVPGLEGTSRRRAPRSGVCAPAGRPPAGGHVRGLTELQTPTPPPLAGHAKLTFSQMCECTNVSPERRNSLRQ